MTSVLRRLAATTLVAVLVVWAPARAETGEAPPSTGASAAAAEEEEEGEGGASTPTAAADGVVAEAGEVTCSDITYTPASASGAQLGTLCTPSVVTSHTTVLLVHGGGGYQGSRADLAAWQEVYADAGVPTLAIDYTLTGDRGEAAIYPLAEQNVKAAVEYLRLVGADLGTDRVVVQGHSAGARLGAIVLTTPDDPSFAGPELRAGVSDAIDGFIGFYGYYGGDQFEAEAYYGSASRQAADAVTNAGRATGPTVLVHSIDDGFVPVQHSRRLAEALQAAGPGGELDLVADAGHGFDGYAQAELTEAGRRSADHLLAWLSRH